ncbi:MAG: hypothetical protein HOD92_07635 [Deltaproteobacteria bacterium]|nr:hypothetical protein [Deltaproteobacteria bacterium]MBT4527012.1 hypothetical protein [Deltaproteobacteria bacterium]
MITGLRRSGKSYFIKQIIYFGGCCKTKQSLRLVSMLEPSYQPINLKSQYVWFSKKYPKYCLFFQVGKYYEFYGDRAIHYGPLFNLVVNDCRRFAGKQCGFPRSYINHYHQLAVNLGMDTIIVKENGYYLNRLKKRVVVKQAQNVGQSLVRHLTIYFYFRSAQYAGFLIV